MSSDKAVGVIYTNISKMSQPAESCNVCSPRIKEFLSHPSKNKAGIFFSSSGEMIPSIVLKINESNYVTALRKHAYSNILKILPPKNDKFQIKKSDIFHISAQNIDCGYSLEPPQQKIKIF